MKKLLMAFLLVILLSPPAFSQRNPQRLRGQNAAPRPAIEDVVLGYYVSQFQQVADVSDELFAKVLPFLRQFIQDRFEITNRRRRALNQLQTFVQQNDADEEIKRAIREIDKTDADLQSNQEKFLSNVDPFLNTRQQAKVRMFQVMSDQRIRQMLDRIQNLGNRQAVRPER
jgi:exonuclease VII large subunit